MHTYIIIKYKIKCLFVTLALRIFNATLCSQVVCKQASIECRPVARGGSVGSDKTPSPIKGPLGPLFANKRSIIL